MSEQVKRDCEHGRQIGKCVDCDYAALERDYATLQAECAKLRQALADSVSKGFTDRINSTARDKNIDECIAEGIRHANKEHDELKAECERLHVELAAIKAQSKPDAYMVEGVGSVKLSYSEIPEWANEPSLTVTPIYSDKTKDTE